VQPHIVGGGLADPGEYPFTAALITAGSPRPDGFTCGGSVLSRSWVLTAAHCVLDTRLLYPDSVYGKYVAPSHYDVLSGTDDLAAGGQRLKVAAIHVHPRYDEDYSDYDVALLRLARPTTAPEVRVIGSSPAELALDDPGAPATVVGWGATRSGSSTASRWLREVDVPVVSDASCAASYPIGFTDEYGFPLEYHASNMICAGLPEGGKDSCQGDSGGPLLVKADDDTWRQIGAVSFGLGCAEAGYPGVYHRLTSSSSWVSRTRRFGPFDPDATAYITRQHLDFLGRKPTAAELTRWRATLSSVPASTIIIDLQASAAWDANAGMNTRLYRAAFLRNPDTRGLDYWVRQRWAGRGPVSIADHFTKSAEFQSRYGSLDDQAFIALIYRNVFDREPDPGGRAYWTRKLASGVSRGRMLYELSNSSEYRRDTATLVRIITTRFGLLRQAPTASEITDSAGRSQRSLVDLLRTSYRYAARFDG
jgi:trypsin